jgi:vacuolar-type H+-ATPase subunit E/Vma4
MAQQRTGTHTVQNAASWARGEARKKINRAANEARAAANRLLREQGLPTPHEAQRAKRKAIRDAAREAGTLAPVGMTQKDFVKNYVSNNKKIGTT